MATVSIYLPDQFADRIESEARRLNMPVSSLIEIAIRDLLNGPDEKTLEIIRQVIEDDRELLERLAIAR